MALQLPIHGSDAFQVAIRKTDLKIGQQTDVGGDLVGCRTQRSKRCQHIRVDLSRVGLRSDRIGVLEPRQFGDKSVKFLDLNNVRW